MVVKVFRFKPIILQVKIIITQAGLLTSPLIVPSRFPSGKEYDKQNFHCSTFVSRLKLELQQQALFRICTGFPFHLS
jgi:hypothetical protein